MKYCNLIIPGFYPDPSIFLVGHIAIHSSKAVTGPGVFLASTEINDARLFVNNDLINARKAFSFAEIGFKVGNILPDKHSP